MNLKRSLSLVLSTFIVLYFSCSTESLDGTQSSESIYGNELPSEKAPANGNGNKFVFEFVGGWSVDCDPGWLAVEYEGWGQFRFFGQPNNPNIEMGIFHLVFTYTNSTGETWVWRDVGIDRYYVKNGELFVSIVGTSSASGSIDRDKIVVGQVILNLDTQETVFVAGNEMGNMDALACHELY